MTQTKITHFQTILKKFAQQKILCIGDLMLDRFIYGKVERVSPEAPIPVLHVDREILMLGGAGNAAANLAKLGCKVVLAGVVGDDDAAKTVRAQSQELFNNADLLITDATRPTTVKARYIASTQQLLRCDWEDTQAVKPAVIEAFKKQLDKAIPSVNAILVSDYGKGLLHGDLCQFIIKAAKKHKIPVVVDPKGRDYAKYAGASVIKPNKKELEEVSGEKLPSNEAIVQASQKLISDLKIEALIATRSKDGMTSVTAKGDVTHIPSITREVFDVSGAGDTVAAVLSAALGAGASYGDAATLGNFAGNIVVGKIGTATVTPDEIEALMIEKLGSGEQKFAVSGLEKLLEWDKAREKVNLWKAQGLKVGFTNGCFDLIHPGHLSLIEQARQQCDRLIIGLNTDTSVQRLKGPSRPVQKERDRAAVLGSLMNVDMVILFDQDTPLELLETVRPDLLVKGSDYTIDTVVGADLVMSYGGKVFLADLKDGFSTTKTIQKMAG